MNQSTKLIQTSFFPQPEKDKPVKIIQVDTSGLQPRKVEEIIPDSNIIPDTYMIYPTGGYHPFYGVPNTFPRYQLPIWPYVKRIKYSEWWSSKEKLDNMRRSTLREHQTIEQLNAHLDKDYYKVSFKTNSYYMGNEYTQIKKNGKHIKYKKRVTISHYFHRLVAFAFIPNPEKKPLVMHINDDTTNYLPENLVWGTPGENSKGMIFRRPDTMEQKYLALVNRGVIKG